MIINRFKLFLLIILLTIGWGQIPIVEKIEFVGYEKTKYYIIEREIQHPIDSPLDLSIAEADRLRLENLGIFSMVDMQVFNSGEGKVKIRFTVIESWRFFPMITPIYDENWGWSIGAMLIINNFRGRDESLTLQGQYGGQNTIGLDFANPWILGDHISLQISIGNDVYNHTFLPYDIKSKHFQLGFGKYFSNEVRWKTGFNLTDKIYSNDVDKREYFNIVPFSNIIYDTRNLYSNPSKGMISTNTFIIRIDLKGNQNNQLLWSQSTSVFNEIIDGKWNNVLGVNFASRLSMSKNLDVWYNYLGGAYSVRGWHVPNNNLFASGEQGYRFGINWITSSIEIRQTVIPKFVTKFNNEFGLSVATFADIGLIGNKVSNIFNQSPMIGLGLGIRIPWPVIKSLRLDYGWSFYNGKYMEQSLHFAFGEKF
jgi:outer membrane protein assembly factor BamA